VFRVQDHAYRELGAVLHHEQPRRIRM